MLINIQTDKESQRVDANLSKVDYFHITLINKTCRLEIQWLQIITEGPTYNMWYAKSHQNLHVNFSWKFSEIACLKDEQTNGPTPLIIE